MHPNFDWNGLTMFKSLYWPFLSTILYCKNFHAFYLPTKLFRSDGWEGGLAAVHGHQPDRRAARHQPRHGVSTALLQNFRNFGNWETWNSTMTTLYCSRLIPSSCIHNLARWTERGAATEVLLSTSPPSWASSVPSSPKVGCLLLSVCTGPLFIVAGYQYNVSKSAVVTLTRCIGNEVVSSVTSTGDHLGAVVTVLSNHSIVLYSDPAVIGFYSCLPCYCFLTKCVR